MSTPQLDCALEITLEASKELLAEVRSSMEVRMGLAPASEADDDSAMEI